jgi:hypothetical protein
MSECYHVSVLNENALCLLIQILPGVGCASWHMMAEFWCVHTKRCKASVWFHNVFGNYSCKLYAIYKIMAYRTISCVLFVPEALHSNNCIAFGTFGWLDLDRFDYEMFELCVGPA